MDWTYTLRNVLVGASLLGLVGGVAGSFALLRRQSLLGDALAHAALPGVCLAFLLTGSKEAPVLLAGAMAAGVVGALAILAVARGSRVKEDAAIGIVLSVFFGLGIVLLTRKGDREEGLRVLRLIAPNAGSKEIEQHAEEITTSAKQQTSTTGFWSVRLRTPILLAFLVAFFNQLSGINAILYFAPRIFEWTGLGAKSALLQSVGIGITNLIFTFLGSLPWSLALAWLGLWLGPIVGEDPTEIPDKLGGVFHGLDVLIVLALAVAVFFYVRRHLRHDREARAADALGESNLPIRR